MSQCWHQPANNTLFWKDSVADFMIFCYKMNAHKGHILSWLLEVQSNLLLEKNKQNKTKNKKLLVRERPLRFPVKAALLPLCANIMPEELRPGYFIPEWSLGKMCSHKDPIEPFPQETSCYRDRTPLGRWALQAFLQASREPKPTADPPCDIIHVKVRLKLQMDTGCLLVSLCL